jgi:hypothetical protein
MKALVSIIWDILSRSGPLLACHMAQLAAAMANVAQEDGASACTLVIEAFRRPIFANTPMRFARMRRCKVSLETPTKIPEIFARHSR